MNLLTRDDLKVLTEKRKGLCISIFMPTRNMGIETQQERICLSNFIREAEEHLFMSGLSAAETKKLLVHAQGLVDDILFWQYQSDGLAIFISSDVFRYYKLPLHFEELVAVTDHFNIKPLLPLLYGNGQFYILALSQNGIKLLQGTCHSIIEINLEEKNIPQSINETIISGDSEKRSQHRASRDTTERTAVLDNRKKNISKSKKNFIQYFSKVDKGLRALFHNERVPLVLAGDDSLLQIYRKVNSYPCLVDKGVVGDIERLSEEELYKQAKVAVQPFFQKAQEDGIIQYRQSISTGQASSDVKEIIPAAYHGRVNLLYIADGYQQWGNFDPATGAVHSHHRAEPGDEDLLDFSTVHTFLSGGNVYIIDQEKMPNGSSLAAVFR